MMKHQKYHFEALFFSAAVCVILTAGCSMGFVGTQSGTMNANTTFNSEWIINQQERHSADERVHEGYSIVKTAASFNQDGFTALNGSVVGVQDLHDGYLYFLIKTESDAAQFRTAVRTMDGVLYAQPNYRYDAPALVADDTARPPYRNLGTNGRGYFGTQDGNLKEDPKADLADWGLTVTGALEAFKRYDAHDAVHPVLAAIIDTGVNSLHEDFYDMTNQSIIFYAKSSLHRGSSVQYTSPQPVPLHEN